MIIITGWYSQLKLNNVTHSHNFICSWCHASCTSSHNFLRCLYNIVVHTLSRLPCRLIRRCMLMFYCTGSSHAQLTSCLDKDFGRPPQIVCLFLLSDFLPTVGCCAFPVAGARIWTHLPLDITSSQSLLSLKQWLKMHLLLPTFNCCSPLWSLEQLSAA